MRRLLNLARKVKEAVEWWGILVALASLPPAVVVTGVIRGVPLDVVLLYVMAGVAYLVVLACEVEPIRDFIRARLAGSSGPAPAVSPPALICESVLWRYANGNMLGPFCPADTTDLELENMTGGRWSPTDDDSLWDKHLHCPMCASNYLGDLGVPRLTRTTIGHCCPN